MDAMSALYGREAELAALGRWADGEGEPRLMVCGPPGIGKSALVGALAQGRDCWVVDCAQLDTLEQLCIALSARRPWEAPPALTLAALDGALAPLVVLDHAEALGEQIGALAGPTRWLIASQRQVEGLPCLRLAGLDDAAARQLLGAPEDALIARCEGSPLALRLVRRRLEQMSAGELLARLGEGALLGGAVEGRTMEQIVRLAWDRLPPHLQRLWAACAVWELPSSLDDAELVAPAMDDGAMVCDGLDALEQASLLQRRDGGWHMAETLRLFARRADPTGFAQAHARMAEGVCAQVERAAARLRERDDPAARRLLHARQLLCMRLLEHGEGAPWRPRMLHALMSLLAEQGMFSALVRWVDAAASPPGEDALTLELHLYRVLAQAFVGDITGAGARLAALKPWTSLAPRTAMTHAYTAGMLAMLRREHEAARAHLERACALARELGDARTLTRALGLMGNVSVRDKRLEQALRDYDEAIQIGVEAGFEVSVMQTRGNRASALLAAGRVAEAITALELIAAFDEAHHQLRNLCVIQGNLGVAYLTVGELEAAAQALDRALALSHTQREPRSLCLQLIARAQVALAAGLPSDALPWLERVGSLIDGLRSPGLQSEHHATRALYHLRLGQHVQAQGWLERAESCAGGEPQALESLRRVMREERPLPPAPGGATLTSVIWRLYGAMSAPVLWVASDGSGFRLGEGAPVRLGRSASSRRLLASMAGRAERTPESIIDPWWLFEAGWPEEVGVPRSGLNRLYTAINRLRGAGLDGLLETAPAGYRLRAQVRLISPDAL
jgi:tetratricopeptide (TPR) repeat protein